MNLIVRSHHTTVDDDLREHADRKLRRLERYLPRLDDIVLEVEHEDTKAAAHRYRVQVTARAAGAILRAEERGGDPRNALDAVVDRLSQQARKHTRRLRGRFPTREAAPEAPVEGVEPEDEDEEALGRIVRVKEFEAKPMSQEEALAQIDLVGHDFFVFLDSATGDYAVLYKRRDGGFGLLTPRRG
jgi:putative sigma-54 modulation protein